MKYVEAIDDPDSPSIFLAGGITGCPDWQAEIVRLLAATDLTIYSPRRSSFDTADPSQTEKQIRWEFDKLRRADAILFWFCSETLCPIVLFELGAHLNDPKPIFVGCHPDYARKADVIIQSRLIRPSLIVVDSLDRVAGQVLDWAAGN